MKIYYPAGLKELAIAAGHKGETLYSKCSNFKRTHTFLVQIWQAMYRKMVASFSIDQPAYQASFTDLSEVLTTEADIFTIIEPMMSNTAKAFNMFTERLSSQDDTWKFWCQFVFEDCLSYVALYIAIRCKNWNLRVLA